MIYTQYMKTPLGPLRIKASERAIVNIEFVHRAGKDSPGSLTGRAVKQLKEYFAGRRRTFDLPLEMKGTRFQTACWNELRKIPYGTAVSYGDIARRLHNPRAGRAVGSANGRNPIAIVVPCHRVIASDGSLGGYTGGLDKKRFLLRLEKIDWKEY
ncbi:MAG: methylated-DNA--[protein]-cysteine S-methyltransferase [Anaerovoracaceae bacterium]|jgi:methylated-DNA-[protein]-cysteine S-methyltransferase